MFEYGDISMQQINDVQTLSHYGNIGFYRFCKVDQVVLINKKTKVAVNYFTHINFAETYDHPEPTTYLTPKPLAINKEYQIAISTYTISINDFIELYTEACATQQWKYSDEKIKEVVELDDVYPTEKKYVPGCDPTGSQYNLVIPFQESLYGNNFTGNYYICELYSKKNILSYLSENDIKKIQDIINQSFIVSHFAVYKLHHLTDRIGNVVCKYNIEIIKDEPKSLGTDYRIEFELRLSEKCTRNPRFSLHIIREHDSMIYENRMTDLTFDGQRKQSYSIDPNQCKNTVILTDTETGLICFADVRDYCVYSNYHSQISPQYQAASGTRKYRRLRVNDDDIKIPLESQYMFERFPVEIEMHEAAKRQQMWNDLYFSAHNYFRAYTAGSHSAAINDVRSIINGRLLWDLEELWIVDPYLTAFDILETVVFCEKENIIIKCLTDFSSINGNTATRESLKYGTELPKNYTDEQLQVSRFEELKQIYSEMLSQSIPADTDLKLEYRTVYANNGMKFHDRYLIMKHRANRTRAWSLGISVNSLGKSHHIIQIVEAPVLVAKLMESIWNDTCDPVCLIYKT